MTTIGFLGSGRIGSTVAKLAVANGFDVVMSNSRGPETLDDLIAELGPDHARAATAEEAARAGDLVVLTIPLARVPEVPVERLAEKVVVDTCNYYVQRDGEIDGLGDGSTTSSSWVQEQLPGAVVVKAFNNINYVHLAALARPAGDPQRTTLPIAGDDDFAKKAVTELLDAIGYDALDAGSLADSWRFEPDTPAYGTPYMQGEFSFPPAPDSARPADEATLAQALAAARR